jgi:ubiquinone/menaquinone biosynthesis C-methylase UbiE
MHAMLTTPNAVELIERSWQRLRRKVWAACHGAPAAFSARHAEWPKTQCEFEEFWMDGEHQAAYFDASRLAFYREVLGLLPKQPCRVLDLGCGNGYFLRLVADAWRTVGLPLLVGVDYAEQAVRAATRLVPEATFRTSQADRTGFPDASFDVVMAMEVFEHLARPRAALQEAWRVVAPGGRLLITVPDGTQDWWTGHSNFWSAEAFLRFLHPLPVWSIRRLDGGRALAFEVTKAPAGQPPAVPLMTRARNRLAARVRGALGRQGWELVRRRPRPTYPAELNRYASQLPHIEGRIRPGGVVLDVGSGHYPFPHATILSELYLGPNRHRTEEAVRDGRPFVVFDIHAMPFRDHSVDFAYCSHVLEHVEDPARACAELVRVARDGYIETPTLGKDVLFAWAEGRHRWHVVAIGERLVFFEYTPRQLQGIRSTAWWDLMHDDSDHPLQQVFYANEDVFNVMFAWRDRFQWTVYRLDGSVETSEDEPRR